ncbi:MAG: hypothetical protein K1X29_03830 [Bdellovibrionales bacterium]|nr:hypothetical protein [Bdellovibrionales bacterium]
MVHLKTYVASFAHVEMHFKTIFFKGPFSFLDKTSGSINAETMVNIELRRQGWSPLPIEELESRFFELNTLLTPS